MRYRRPIGQKLRAVFVSFLAALSLSGCNDISTAPPPEPPPLSPDATLSTLTVNPGTLQPAFSSDVANYTVDVASTVASVTVTAQPQDAGATVSINGQTTTSLSVPLGSAGSNTPIPIVVTAPNGSQSTYLVTVNRAALGGNNNLQSLTVSPGTLAPTFTASTTSYTVDVASNVASVTVTATLQDTNASMTVNGQGTSSGQARTITLNGAGSSTLVTIVVTAPNGSQKTYFMTVNRAALGGDNNLSALSVTPGPLTPAFSANTLSYTVDVATAVTSVTVTATKSDPNAVLSGSVTAGTGQATGQATITLNGPGASTPITILVTAPNGSQKTYTVIVNRAAPSSDNNLSALSVTGQTLSPAFNANTLNYTVAVASGVTSVAVSATKSDPNAVMSGSVTAGAGQATGQATITLNGPGTSTPVSITVTAPNGVPKTYTVTVNRAALASDNNLSALSVTPGSLVPGFSSGQLSYTVDVASTVTQVNVSATKSDPNAVMSGSVTAGAGIASGQAMIPLNGAGTPTLISITVTAPNQSQKIYTITVNRASVVNVPPVANAGPDQGGQALLSLISLDGSASSDANGDPLTYSWTFVSKPALSLAVLIDPTSASPTFILDFAGDYVVQLIVNDGTVDSLPDSVTITTN